MKDHRSIEDSADALLRAIAPNLPEHLLGQLMHGARRVPRFLDFLQTHRLKIRSKFRKAKEVPRKMDIVAELDVAQRLLANRRFTVEYEPYAAERTRSSEERGNPDFRVVEEDGGFIVEIKRIREGPAMTRYCECMGRIRSAIRKIPSPLVVSVVCNSVDLGPEYAESLWQSIDVVVAHCCEIVNCCKNTLQGGESRRFPIDGFSELQLEVTHDPDKVPDSPTEILGGSMPILFKQGEDFKLTDKLTEGLHQFRAGLPNVLIICCHSLTHDPRELEIAVSMTCRQAAEGDESFFRKKKFNGVADFEERFKLLSAAVVLSNGPNSWPPHFVWENPGAEFPLDKRTLEFFARM